MKKKLILALSLAACISLNAGVLATVNGTNVTDEELSAMIQGDIKAIPADMKKNLVEQMVQRVLLTEEAKKSGIMNTPEFKENLSKLGDNIALELWMKNIFDSIKISSEKAEDFYNKNKNTSFVTQAKISAKHILVDDINVAKSIISKLSKLKGEALEKEFSKIATEKSTDTGSAKDGGDLGFFPKESMIKPFSDAAFALKKGEITKSPVKSEFGYHVILKTGDMPSKVIPFAEVKNEIVSHLQMEEFKKNVEKKIQELKSKAKITYAN